MPAMSSARASDPVSSVLRKKYDRADSVAPLLFVAAINSPCLRATFLSGLMRTVICSPGNERVARPAAAGQDRRRVGLDLPFDELTGLVERLDVDIDVRVGPVEARDRSLETRRPAAGRRSSRCDARWLAPAGPPLTRQSKQARPCARRRSQFSGKRAIRSSLLPTQISSPTRVAALARCIDAAPSTLPSTVTANVSGSTSTAAQPPSGGVPPALKQHAVAVPSGCCRAASAPRRIAYRSASRCGRTARSRIVPLAATYK